MIIDYYYKIVAVNDELKNRCNTNLNVGLQYELSPFTLPKNIHSLNIKLRIQEEMGILQYAQSHPKTSPLKYLQKV